jgi:hypothetical protein
MRLFVRLSLVGLVVLIGFGYASNQLQSISNPASNKNDVPVEVTSVPCVGLGVTLTVEFQTNKQAINKCIKNYVGTSWDLFATAGLSVTGTEKYPTGFVCRIQNFPTATDEPCRDTPNPNFGSWAYFIAEPGSTTWKYSAWGASGHHPKCGSNEAWIFRYANENVETPPTVKPKTRVCTSN